MLSNKDESSSQTVKVPFLLMKIHVERNSLRKFSRIQNQFKWLFGAQN